MQEHRKLFKKNYKLFKELRPHFLKRKGVGVFSVSQINFSPTSFYFMYFSSHVLGILLERDGFGSS